MKPINLTSKQLEALRFIRNKIVHDGSSPSINDVRKALGFNYPRSAALVLEALKRLGYISRRADASLQLLKDLPDRPDNAKTVEVPLVGRVACGLPILAQESIEAMVPVSTMLAKPGNRYFILRAVGDSMNAAGIEDGDMVLVRQQPVARNGDKVVALIDDEATIKEFRRDADVVALLPRSRDKRHQPILVTGDFQVQGVVVATVPGLGEYGK